MEVSLMVSLATLFLASDFLAFSFLLLLLLRAMSVQISLLIANAGTNVVNQFESHYSALFGSKIR